MAEEPTDLRDEEDLVKDRDIELFSIAVNIGAWRSARRSVSLIDLIVGNDHPSVPDLKGTFTKPALERMLRGANYAVDNLLTMGDDCLKLTPSTRQESVIFAEFMSACKAFASGIIFILEFREEFDISPLKVILEHLRKWLELNQKTGAKRKRNLNPVSLAKEIHRIVEGSFLQN